MAKFRKKPVVIDAMQWDGSETDALGIVAWLASEDSYALYVAEGAEHKLRKPEERVSLMIPWADVLPSAPPFIAIPTLEGDHRSDTGDFIIRGVQGEFYPCKPDIFEQTYEAVES